MSSRIREVLGGLLSFVVLALLLVGPPVALWMFVGWPLPEGLPSFGEISAAARSGIDDAVIIKTLALLAWLAWAQLALAAVIEVVAVIRGLPAPRLPVMPGVQVGTGRLVASVALLFGSLAGSRSGLVPLAPPESASIAETPVVYLSEPVDVVEDSAPTPAADLSTEASVFTWTVERNDSWWQIAEQTLGDGLRWRDIRSLNIGRTMLDGATISAATEHINEGWVLRVPAPERSTVASGSPVPVPAGRVVVESGDNLWALSEEHLEEAVGREAADEEIAPYWREVVDENAPHLTDPDLIRVGQVIDLPVSGGEPEGESAKSLPAEVQPRPLDEAPAEQPDPLPQTPVPTAGPTTTISTTSTEPSGASSGPESAEADDLPVDPAEGEADQTEDDRAPIPGLLGVAGTLIAVGVAGESLRRRRRREQRIPAGTPAPEPPEELDDLRAEIVHVADTDQVDFLIRALGEIASSFAARRHNARVRLVQSSQARIEAVLSEPVLPAPDGWIPEASGAAWTTKTGNPSSQRPEAITHPALVSIGSPDESGQLFIDLEAEGLLNVIGDDEDLPGFLRSMLLELAMSPLSQMASVIVCGDLDGVPDGTLERVRRVVDWTEVADGVLAWALQTKDVLAASRWRTPAAGRAVGDRADDLAPLIVVLSDEPEDERFNALCTLIGETVLPVVVIGVGTKIEGATDVYVADGRLRIPNLNLTCEAQRVSDVAGGQVNELLTAADEVPDQPAEVVDETAKPCPEATSDPYVDPPFDVLVHVLGEIEVIGGNRPLRPKQAAVVVHIALHSPVSTEQVQHAIWSLPADNRKQRLADSMSQARSRLGAEHFPAATDGRYRVGPRVLTDLELFERRVDYAATQSPTEAAETLRGAIDLVTGPVFTYRNTDRHSFTWVDTENWISRTEMKVAGAVVDLAELYLEIGDFESAIWAAERGLLALPTHPPLARLLIEGHSAAGNKDAVRGVYESYVSALDHMGIDDVDPELEEAYGRATSGSC